MSVIACRRPHSLYFLRMTSGMGSLTCPGSSLSDCSTAAAIILGVSPAVLRYTGWMPAPLPTGENDGATICAP